jgi:hypothetical protein
MTLEVSKVPDFVEILNRGEPFQYARIMQMANFTGYTEDEIQRYVQLRAIEWSSWVSFVAMGLSTPLLLLTNPVLLVLGIVILNIIWSIIFARSPNISLANAGVFLNKLKWLTAPLTAVIFIFQHNPKFAVLSVFWPIIVMLVGLLHKPMHLGEIARSFYHHIDT